MAQCKKGHCMACGCVVYLTAWFCVAWFGLRQAIRDNAVFEQTTGTIVSAEVRRESCSDQNCYYDSHNNRHCNTYYYTCYSCYAHVSFTPINMTTPVTDILHTPFYDYRDYAYCVNKCGYNYPVNRTTSIWYDPDDYSRAEWSRPSYIGWEIGTICMGVGFAVMAFFVGRFCCRNIIKRTKYNRITKSYATTADQWKPLDTSASTNSTGSYPVTSTTSSYPGTSMVAPTSFTQLAAQQKQMQMGYTQPQQQMGYTQPQQQMGYVPPPATAPPSAPPAYDAPPPTYGQAPPSGPWIMNVDALDASHQHHYLTLTFNDPAVTLSQVEQTVWQQLPQLQNMSFNFIYNSQMLARDTMVDRSTFVDRVTLIPQSLHR